MVVESLHSVFLCAGKKVVAVDFDEVENQVSEIWIRDLELLGHTFDGNGQYLKTEGFEDEFVRFRKEDAVEILRTTLKEIIQEEGDKEEFKMEENEFELIKKYALKFDC